MGIDLPLQIAQLGQLSLGCPRLMDPVLVEELVTTLSQETTAVPLWEVVLFFVLSTITYYRKQLSSNRVYMDQHKPHRVARDWVSTTPPLSPPPEPAVPCSGGHEVEPPPSVVLESALKGLPSHLHAKLKSMQEKLIKAMAMRHKDGSLRGEEPEDLLSGLPQDAMLQVSRFLQPQDVLQLSQASRDLHEICSQPEIWRAQWLARFGALWDSSVAQEMLSRRHIHMRSEQLTRRGSWKAFYFQFEQCWMDWLIAGYNSEERCLVALHGEVYDLTAFLDHHPGSRETIMVNAGSDATAFFEDVGHSNQARARMRDFVVLSPNPAVTRCALQSVAAEHRERKKRLEHALWKEAEGGLAATATAAACSGAERPTCRACGGQSFSWAPFETAPCPGGQHLGLVHAVYDVLGSGWFAWWSCCGQVVGLQGGDEQAT